MVDNRAVTMQYKPYEDSDLFCNVIMSGKVRPQAGKKNRVDTHIIGYSLQEAIDTRDKLDE